MNMRGDVGISRKDAGCSRPTSTSTRSFLIRLSVDRFGSFSGGVSRANVSVRLRGSAGCSSSLMMSVGGMVSTARRKSSGTSSFGVICLVSVSSSTSAVNCSAGILIGGTAEVGVGVGLGVGIEVGSGCVGSGSGSVCVGLGGSASSIGVGSVASSGCARAGSSSGSGANFGVVIRTEARAGAHSPFGLSSSETSYKY